MKKRILSFLLAVSIIQLCGSNGSEFNRETYVSLEYELLDDGTVIILQLKMVDFPFSESYP